MGGSDQLPSAAERAHAKYHAGKEKDRTELENPEHERGYYNPKVWSVFGVFGWWFRGCSGVV